MDILNENEMISYQGGVKISIGVVTAITAAITFFLGVWDGYKNPKACNKR